MAGASGGNSWLCSVAVLEDNIVLEAAVNVDPEELEMLFVGLAIPESELLPLPVAEEGVLAACKGIWGRVQHRIPSR